MIKRSLDSEPGQKRRVHVFLFWAVVTVIWFSSLGLRALIHPDEGRYADISLTMLQSGDWITPRLNGLLYFEKPALQYWAGAASFSLFGINEFAARFWPGLTSFLTVLVVWSFGKRLYGRDIAGKAALIVAGAMWIVGNGHFLTLDMGATFFLTLALFSFLLAQDEQSTPRARRWLMWLCWAAMAGATLSKGLVGLLIPGMTIILYSLAGMRWAIWKRLHLLSGLLVYFCIAAPWFIVVSRRNPEFANFFFVHEHFQRFLTTEHKRTGAIWYFVPVLLLGFFPWTTLLGRALREGWKSDGAGFQGRQVLLIWCIFTFAFFSVSGSKLPSYILPMFPALGMLLALGIGQVTEKAWRWHLLVPALLFAALVGLYPFAGRAVTLEAPLEVWQHMLGFMAVAGLTGLLGTWLAWRAIRRGQLTTGLAALSLTSIVAMTLAMTGHDSYGQLKSSKRIVHAMGQYVHDDTELFSVRMHDQTFPFYMRRPVTLVDYRDEFALGQDIEPARWIPSLAQFESRWRKAARATAMMHPETYDELSKNQLPMQVVYRDARRLVVVKP